MPVISVDQKSADIRDWQIYTYN